MEFSLKKPMSAQEYKDRMGLPSYWRKNMVLLGFAATFIMVLRLIEGAVASDWVVYLSFVLFAAFTSWIALQTQYSVNGEWHLFRGHVDDVKFPQGEGGDVYVWFDGDERDDYTIFTAADYATHRYLLVPGKQNLLIVRRSTKRGSSVFRGTFSP